MFWLSGIFSAIECTWIIRLSWLKLLLTCTRRKKNGKDYVERSNTCSTLMAPQKILLLSVAAMKQTPLKSVVVVLPCSTAKHKCCCHLGPLFCFRLFPYVLLSDLFMAGKGRWGKVLRIVNWGELLASKGCEIIAATYLPFELCTYLKFGLKSDDTERLIVRTATN